ncbi:MFS transporter [Herbiconiux daphne]|uniref:MFS transporter n=1 Tax=Herbiconiux daphne TaxID=2970914 RepID=A0ABT2H2N4_9MICO|nr:MFS transporter [Herbiconiux daphne]MCS5734211.1 MFS transporter [Herbiconiux daphne]
MTDHAIRSREGVLSRRYRLITIGAFALVFVAAFENLAVTTVMPVISAELDGASLYAVAFSGPLAVSVLGMVLAGNWCDRNGPRVPLYASVALFATGLVVAGTATTMGTMVAGRLVHGVGGGAMTVALYVIVARVYPTALQPKIFGMFAAAWVLPALIGPYLAGVLGETVGWRWVFLGVAALVVPALAMVVPAMRYLAAGAGRAVADAGAATDAGTGADAGTATDAGTAPAGPAAGGNGAPGTTGTPVPWSLSRIAWAVALGAAILGLSLSTELEGAAVIVLAAAALVVALVALRPLLPRRTLLGARGLPSVILIRLVLAGGYFAAEVYLPYLLTGEFGLSPSTAGLALTAAGIAWGATSWLQGQIIRSLPTSTALRLGTAFVAGAAGLAAATALLGLPAWVVIAGWAISGAGMGLAYPRLSVLTLTYSEPHRQGFNSAALSIADAAGPAMSLALAGILFQALGGETVPFAFGGVFVFATVIAVAALLLSGRTATR